MVAQGGGGPPRASSVTTRGVASYLQLRSVAPRPGLRTPGGGGGTGGGAVTARAIAGKHQFKKKTVVGKSNARAAAHFAKFLAVFT